MKRLTEKGQAMVELALMLPVLVLIFLPLADIGRLFYFGMTLTQAVRAGAQYGISQDVLGASDFTSIASGITAAAVAAGTNIGLSSSDVTTADRYWKCGTSGTTGTDFSNLSSQCSGDTTNVYVRVIATKTMDSLFTFEWAGVSGWSVTRSAQIRVQ